jgi:hypothetical protein
LQVFSHGSMPRALTVASSALVITMLAIAALGLSVKSSMFLRK